MKSEQIQTLHPQAGKTNKKISLDKYVLIREQLLTISLFNTLLNRYDNDLSRQARPRFIATPLPYPPQNLSPYLA
jgi:hypothetical protein